LPDRQGSRDWTLFLGDMQRFCSGVLLYCDGMNAEQFVADELVTDAVLRNLELLGEAANRSRTRSAIAIQRFPGGGLQVCEMSWPMLISG
jgi:uncharacterized protein with HEPN domain